MKPANLLLLLSFPLLMGAGPYAEITKSNSEATVHLSGEFICVVGNLYQKDDRGIFCPLMDAKSEFVSCEKPHDKS